MDKTVASLSADEKKWFAIAITGIVVADGVISQDEIVYLQKALAFLENKATIDKMIVMIKERKLPPLKPLRINPVIGFEIFKELAMIAASDTKLAKKEAEFLKLAGNRLGFDTNFIQKVISWSVKLTEVRKEEAKLKELAKSFPPVS